MLECGHGGASKLLQFSSLDRLAAILISHMHPDHFFDLVPLKYGIASSGRPRLPLFLPPGGAEMLAGIARALNESDGFWASAYDLHTFDPGQVLDVAGMRVSMAPSHHFIPAWAMTFESNGSRLAYTSDTSTSDSVVDLVSSADLLLAEAAVLQQSRPSNEQGHMTPRDAGCLARRAGVRQLVITHYLSNAASKILSEAAAGFGAPCELAVEGARFKI
jgi:ribonuclease BN (tRNA processing enzyme)